MVVLGGDGRAVCNFGRDRWAGSCKVPAFREIVRDRVVLELEKATGGNVEMQSLTWNVSKLEVEAKGITIRGLEPPTDVPLAHVDRLYARVHIVSFFSANIDLQQLTLEQPVIHVIVKSGRLDQRARAEGEIEWRSLAATVRLGHR